jgi:pyruvate dehydrogenase E1 component alpha subunit
MGDIVQRFQDTPENLLALYEIMLRIRKFEDAVVKRYEAGEIPGFCHTYQGEEPIAAGACAALKEGDAVFSTHRGHGHAVAKGVPVKELMAELYGRSGGTNQGRGGSMHIYKKAVGFMGTNGMVGGGIGLAVGAAFEMKYNNKPNVSLTFFGDGASNMGIFYESLNLASVKKLPVIFLCENNKYATVTPLRKVAANTQIASRGLAFKMNSICIDGNDVTDVYEAVAEAREKAVAGEGPTLIEARTYRYYGHFVGDLLYGVYRTKEEMETKKFTSDSISAFRLRLERVYQIEENRIDGVEEKVQKEIDAAVEYAQNSPFPDPASVENNLFVKESF